MLPAGLPCVRGRHWQGAACACGVVGSARSAGLGPPEGSLCEGWRVKVILAHLITSLVVSPTQMAFRVLHAGGISQAMNAVAVELGQRDPQELMDILRKHAFFTCKPPGLPASAPLADVVVHTADIRWALTDDRTDQGEVSRLEESLLLS